MPFVITIKGSGAGLAVFMALALGSALDVDALEKPGKLDLPNVVIFISILIVSSWASLMLFESLCLR